MLFADADGFWKLPNIYDALGVVGFVIGVASIWLSWWLSKTDIQKRLDEAADRASEAAREEVRRVAHAVLQSGVAATIRSLELAREVCNGKRWPRAVELCILAREQLSRVLTQPVADQAMQTDLENVPARLQDCIRRLREQPRSGTGDVPDEVLRELDEAILILHRTEGRMTGIRPRGDHG